MDTLKCMEMIKVRDGYIKMHGNDKGNQIFQIKTRALFRPNFVTKEHNRLCRLMTVQLRYFTVFFPVIAFLLIPG